MLSAPVMPSSLLSPGVPALRAAPIASGRRALADGGGVGPGEIPLRFTNALARAGLTPEERAADAAQEFVAMALVQPTLRSLRESNGAAPPFAPGDAERKFVAMLDAEQARAIVSSSNFPLVGAIRERILGTYAPPPPPPPAGARALGSFSPAQRAAAQRIQNHEAPHD